MKTITITLFLFLSCFAFSQVGVGNTDPKANLDISASSTTSPTNEDGILIPRIDNFPSTNPTADQDGMMVFYTGTALSGKGFYYWDNGANNWISVTGTKKVNDLEDGRSDNDGSDDGSSIYLGVLAGQADDNSNNRNVGIGFNAMGNNSSGFNNTAVGYLSSISNFTGINNTALGAYSLWNCITNNNTAIGSESQLNTTTGSGNTSLGYASMATNTTGNANTALGFQSMLNNTIGAQNTAVGDSALNLNSNGHSNTAIGYHALYDNTSGNYNTAIGHDAGDNNNGSGNVFIGHEAGKDATSVSNTLFVENSDADDNNALIYGEFGTDNTTSGNILRTNAQFQIGNPTLTGYALPIADGTNGQVLATDGTGQINFVNVSSIFIDTDTQNTLNQAYNEGGAGSGRVINANNGAVRINGNDGFLVTGTLGSGNTIDTEITGSGSRMFYNPYKAAFRAGYANVDRWDNLYIGNYSIGLGYGNIASGGASFASGYSTTASGYASTALGYWTNASDWTSVAIGYSSTSSGSTSVAIGNGNLASADESIAIGSDADATGYRSKAFGYNIESPSAYETTLGVFATAYTPASTSGFDNADRLFSIGNGTNHSSRRNALTIYKSGLMNINDEYNMPLTDGTAGQVMTTDGAGNVTFQNPTTNNDDQQIDNFSFNSSTNILTLEIEGDGQAAQTVDLSGLNPTKAVARIIMSVNQSETGAGNSKVNFDTIDFDVGNNFNLTTENYVVPQDGLYRVTTQVTASNSTSTGTYALRIRVDGTQVRRSEFSHHGNGSVVRQVTSILNLTAGQTIDIAYSRPSVGVNMFANDNISFFEIEQL